MTYGMQVERSVMRDIANHLDSIAANASPVKYRDRGICQELDNGWGKRYSGVVSMLFENWPEYTGNPRYPVPFGSYGVSPKDAYMTTKDLWVGIYGEKRRDLCTFLAKKIREVYCD